MIQFTVEEINKIRQKMQARPELLSSMKEGAQAYLDAPMKVPDSGIADWGHYYCCPKCSVRLKFDIDRPTAHVCPQCGAVYSGEPYDGAWWGTVNSRNAGNANRMGWLYLLTGEKKYSDGAKNVILAYAERYHLYEPHGNIPYNGPGRVGAQTIDEASFQQALLTAYDMISDALSPEEIAFIRDELFLPSAEFLVAHRTNQLHNHEVIIDSTIAMIGICFERKDLIDFAVYGPYGLQYQLDFGVQDNGIWFEGSFGYHYYALLHFIGYEKFALHTPYSLVHHPNYVKMLNVALSYMQDDNRLPMLGDTSHGHMGNCPDIYEFMYRELREERMLAMLYRLYESKPRDSFGALVYGVDELPPLPQVEPEAIFRPETGKPGHTILHGADGRWLLIKQDRYGGEHDHYDRLGISYRAFGKPVAPDLGTSSYGAVLHYDYFKNTGAHNTVVIGEENHSPANAFLTRCDTVGDKTYVEAVCDWRLPYQGPDSFTICQWDAEVYRNVKMTRRIIWTDTYFAEAFLAEGAPEGRTVDWVMHFMGKRCAQDEGGQWQTVEKLSDKKPFRHIHSVRKTSADAAMTHLYENENVYTRVYSAPFAGETLTGIGPDNPSYKEIPYLIERQKGNKCAFFHVFESGEKRIKRVQFGNDLENMEAELEMTDGSVQTLQWK